MGLEKNPKKSVGWPLPRWTVDLLKILKGMVANTNSFYSLKIETQVL